MMSKVKAKLSAFFQSHPTAVKIIIGAVCSCLCIGIGLTAGHLVLQNIAPDTDLRSPQYEVQPLSEDFEFQPEGADVYSADDGKVKIGMDRIKDDTTPMAALNTDDTDAIWAADAVITYNSFTTQEKVVQANGSIGVLSIPTLSLSVNVFSTEDELESMTRGLAHFSHSSSWDGNIAVCGHNINYDLTDGYFKNLYTLKTGDEVRFTTSLGERIYKVTTIKEISDSDWSGTARTLGNRITMITCISGKPDSRLMVIAEESR